MSGKITMWKRELDELVDETGISLRDVCEYVGVSYRDNVSFYYKLPKKREMYIGIGMAFARDLSVINDWIIQYAGKKRLYSKEALSDLIWIYLINSNHKDLALGSMKAGETNYYRLYDECQRRVQETYIEIWNEFVENGKDTAFVDSNLEAVRFDKEFVGLRAFVAENMDSFKTAYSKPRNMLNRYLQTILDTYTRLNGGKPTPVNFLRGYLDDSMINYLTGDQDKINTIDMKSRGRVINSKTVPKLKRTHIAICLALGMTTEEINDYLDMMGYQPLDPALKDEKVLLDELSKWEAAHPQVERYKQQFIFDGTDSIPGEMRMTEQEELQAVSDMLMMRSDLDYECSMKGLPFPYMKE